MAYTQLLEQDRLDEARALDDRYHLAKLIAQGGMHGNPAEIWTEHERVRAALLAGQGVDAVPPTEDDWLERVAAIHRKMQRAGLVTSISGAVH